MPQKGNRVIKTMEEARRLCSERKYADAYEKAKACLDMQETIMKNEEAVDDAEVGMYIYTLLYSHQLLEKLKRRDEMSFAGPIRYFRERGEENPDNRKALAQLMALEVIHMIPRGVGKELVCERAEETRRRIKALEADGLLPENQLWSIFFLEMARFQERDKASPRRLIVLYDECLAATEIGGSGMNTELVCAQVREKAYHGKARAYLKRADLGRSLHMRLLALQSMLIKLSRYPGFYGKKAVMALGERRIGRVILWMLHAAAQILKACSGVILGLMITNILLWLNPRLAWMIEQLLVLNIGFSCACMTETDERPVTGHYVVCMTATAALVCLLFYGLTLPAVIRFAAYLFAIIAMACLMCVFELLKRNAVGSQRREKSGGGDTDET